tara:strand:- start:461 stop:667 length:207 start_codon:yes stop_codon:yes gene_type:complete
MADGVGQTGPMDEESLRSITRTLEEPSPGGVSTRWIVLAVLTTALVLDQVGVLPVPIEDLLVPLLSVL